MFSDKLQIVPLHSELGVFHVVHLIISLRQVIGSVRGPLGPLIGLENSTAQITTTGLDLA